MIAGLAPMERAIINRFQGGLPVADRPFATVAASLGTDEATLLATLERMLAEGWLTRIGPLFNPDRMGGGLTLAAMRAPVGRYEEVAARVNAFPEVAHNYQRDHELNMWFVIATERPEQVAAVLGAIEQATGLPVCDFPKRREFYLGLWLLIDDDGPVRTRSIANTESSSGSALDDADRRIVAACQAGLPLISDPCSAIAEQAGISSAEAAERIERMLAAGIIRRIGVVPNHYRLGFRGNGMSVWDVPDELLDEVGPAVGALDFVSHCYERPRKLPLWPYNLFAMVHGRDRDQVREQVGRIAALVGDKVRAHDVLFSTRILKKTGLRLAS